MFVKKEATTENVKLSDINKVLNASIEQEVLKGNIAKEVLKGNIAKEVLKDGIQLGFFKDSIEQEVLEGSIQQEVFKDSIGIQQEILEGSVEQEVSKDSMEQQVLEGSMQRKVLKDSLAQEIFEDRMQREVLKETVEDSLKWEVLKDSIEQEVFEGSIQREVLKEVLEGSIQREVLKDSIEHEFLEGSIQQEVLKDIIEQVVLEGSIQWEVLKDSIQHEVLKDCIEQAVLKDCREQAVLEGSIEQEVLKDGIEEEVLVGSIQQEVLKDDLKQEVLKDCIEQEVLEYSLQQMVLKNSIKQEVLKDCIEQKVLEGGSIRQEVLKASIKEIFERNIQHVLKDSIKQEVLEGRIHQEVFKDIKQEVKEGSKLREVYKDSTELEVLEDGVEQEALKDNIKHEVLEDSREQNVLEDSIKQEFFEEFIQQEGLKNNIRQEIKTELDIYEENIFMYHEDTKDYGDQVETEVEKIDIKEEIFDLPLFSDQISKPKEISEKNKLTVQTSVTLSAKIHYLYLDVQNIGNLQKGRVQNHIVLVTDDRDTFDVSLVGFDKRVDVLKVPKLALTIAYDSIANHKSFGKGTIYIFTCGIHDLFDTIFLDDCLNALCHCPPMMLNLSANIVDPDYLIKNALKLSKEILQSTSNDIAIFSGLIPVAINQFNKTTYNSRQCLKNHLAKPSPNVLPSKYNEYNSAIDWYNKFVKFYAKTIGEIPWDLDMPYFNTGRPLNILLPNGYDLRPNEVLKRLNKVKSLSKGLMLKLSSVAVGEVEETLKNNEIKMSVVVDMPVAMSRPQNMIKTSKTATTGLRQFKAFHPQPLVVNPPTSHFNQSQNIKCSSMNSDIAFTRNNSIKRNKIAPIQPIIGPMALDLFRKECNPDWSMCATFRVQNKRLPFLIASHPAHWCNLVGSEGFDLQFEKPCNSIHGCSLQGILRKVRKVLRVSSHHWQVDFRQEGNGLRLTFFSFGEIAVAATIARTTPSRWFLCFRPNTLQMTRPTPPPSVPRTFSQESTSVSENIDPATTEGISKILFSKVCFVGRSDLIGPLKDCNINSSMIYHNFYTGNDALLRRLFIPAAAGTLSCLVFDISVISKPIISPECLKRGCKEPLYHSAFKIKPSGNSQTLFKELKNLISEQLQLIQKLIEKLSVHLPVIILPLAPMRIYCHDESSMQNHQISHSMSGLRTCVASGPSNLWKQAIAILVKSWYKLMDVTNRKYDPLQCLSRCKSANQMVFPFVEDVADILPTWSEPDNWKSLINSYASSLIPVVTQKDSSNISKQILSTSNANKMSRSISQQRSKPNSNIESIGNYKGPKSENKRIKMRLKPESMILEEHSGFESIGNYEEPESENKRIKIKSKLVSKVQVERSGIESIGNYEGLKSENKIKIKSKPESKVQDKSSSIASVVSYEKSKNKRKKCRFKPESVVQEERSVFESIGNSEELELENKRIEIMSKPESNVQDECSVIESIGNYEGLKSENKIIKMKSKLESKVQDKSSSIASVVSYEKPESKNKRKKNRFEPESVVQEERSVFESIGNYEEPESENKRLKMRSKLESNIEDERSVIESISNYEEPESENKLIQMKSKPESKVQDESSSSASVVSYEKPKSKNKRKKIGSKPEERSGFEAIGIYREPESENKRIKMKSKLESIVQDECSGIESIGNNEGPEPENKIIKMKSKPESKVQDKSPSSASVVSYEKPKSKNKRKKIGSKSEERSGFEAIGIYEKPESENKRIKMRAKLESIVQDESSGIESIGNYEGPELENKMKIKSKVESKVRDECSSIASIVSYEKTKSKTKRKKCRSKFESMVQKERSGFESTGNYEEFESENKIIKIRFKPESNVQDKRSGIESIGNCEGPESENKIIKMRSKPDSLVQDERSGIESTRNYEELESKNKIINQRSKPESKVQDEDASIESIGSYKEQKSESKIIIKSKHESKVQDKSSDIKSIFSYEKSKSESKKRIMRSKHKSNVQGENLGFESIDSYEEQKSKRKRKKIKCKIQHMSRLGSKISLRCGTYSRSRSRSLVQDESLCVDSSCHQEKLECQSNGRKKKSRTTSLHREYRSRSQSLHKYKRCSRSRSRSLVHAKSSSVEFIDHYEEVEFESDGKKVKSWAIPLNRECRSRSKSSLRYRTHSKSRSRSLVHAKSSSVEFIDHYEEVEFQRNEKNLKSWAVSPNIERNKSRSINIDTRSVEGRKFIEESESDCEKRSRSSFKARESCSSDLDCIAVNLQNFETELCKRDRDCFLEYSFKLNEMRLPFEEEFEIYKTIPDLYSGYKKYNKIFVTRHHEKIENLNTQLQEKAFNIFWKSNFDAIKAEAWQTRQLDLIKEYEEKSFLKSSSQMVEGKTKKLFVFSDALSLIASLCDRVPVMGPAALTIIETFRNLDTNEAYKLFTTSRNVTLLGLLQKKFKSLSQTTTDDDTRFLYRRAAEWIPNLLEEAKNWCKTNREEPDNGGSPININAIAELTLGRGFKETLHHIKWALTYEGIPDPSPMLINDLFLKVSAIHKRI